MLWINKIDSPKPNNHITKPYNAIYSSVRGRRIESFGERFLKKVEILKYFFPEFSGMVSESKKNNGEKKKRKKMQSKRKNHSKKRYPRRWERKMNTT